MTESFFKETKLYFLLFDKIRMCAWLKISQLEENEKLGLFPSAYPRSLY